MKVYAPNKQYTGVSAGISFCNGVGETDDPHLLNWFDSHGYEVEEPPEENYDGPEGIPTEDPEKNTSKKGKTASQKAGE